MRFRITVFGAGSIVGRAVCKRASNLGWEVNAFTIRDWRHFHEYRKRIFYTESRNWEANVNWNVEYAYDTQFDKFHDDIANSQGLVYIPEPTPAIQQGKIIFEENAVKLAHTIGEWSVRHFIAVEDTKMKALIGSDAERAIGEAHPTMIVSLMRPGQLYTQDEPRTCLSLYKHKTLTAMGVKQNPLEATEDTLAAHAVTTLIHNSSDANTYRVLDRVSLIDYLETHKNPDDPEDRDPEDPDQYSFSAMPEDEEEDEDGQSSGSGEEEDEDEDERVDNQRNIESKRIFDDSYKVISAASSTTSLSPDTHQSSLGGVV